MSRNDLDSRLKQYTSEDLAESFVFPISISKKEKIKSDAILKATLTKKRNEISKADILKGKLLQLRFQIEEYINDNYFDRKKSFGYFLAQYIHLLNKKNIDFANEINLKPSELSQYLNNHRKPPKNILVRLELHSQKTITAVEWYRLIEKENIQELKTNKALRKQEQLNVKL
ncbi:MAG: hypothetical protein JWQ09_351 [Segetibacter sp.]|nr:hypothetical protein [Segetibacter sp.]